MADSWSAINANAAARRRRAEAEKAKTPTESTAEPEYPGQTPITEDSTWGETGGAALSNLFPSFNNLMKKGFQGAYDTITDKRGPLGPISDVLGYGVGALESAGHGMRGLMGDTPPPLSPRGQAAAESGKAIVNKVANPAITFANDPAGTTFDLASLMGVKGKLPTKAAPEIKPSTIVREARVLKDDLNRKIDLFPDKEIPIAPVVKAVQDAIDERKGMTRDAQIDIERDYPGLQRVIKNENETADLPTIRNMRQYLQDRGDYHKGPKEDGLIGAAKDAFDEALAKTHPDAATALNKANQANVKFKETEGIVDMMTGGSLWGNIRTNVPIETTKRIAREIDPKSETALNYGPATTEKLTDIVQKTPDTRGGGLAGLAAAITSGSGVAGAIGWGLGGGPGAAIGASLGIAGPAAHRALKRAKATSQVTRDMTNLVRELNGLSKIERIKRIQGLPPGQRATLLGIFGLTQAGEEE